MKPARARSGHSPEGHTPVLPWETQMEETPNRVTPGADANLVAAAISGDWISRGFKLGIGFWLAGLFVALVGFVLFVFFGAALLASHPNGGTASVSASPPAPDHRSWQEKLKAADEAAVEANGRRGGSSSA